MSKIVVVQYRTRPDAAEENERLVQKVYAELAHEDPGGLRYITFRLADGASFLHCGVTEDGEPSPLPRSAAFAEFTRDLGQRCVVPPQLTEASMVGSYRWWSPAST